MESFIHLQQGRKGENPTQQLHAAKPHLTQGIGQHLSVLTPSAPHMRLMRLILYMWSAMLSEPFTLHRIQPVLLVIYSMRRVSFFMAFVGGRNDVNTREIKFITLCSIEGLTFRFWARWRKSMA